MTNMKECLFNFTLTIITLKKRQYVSFYVRNMGNLFVFNLLLKNLQLCVQAGFVSVCEKDKKKICVYGFKCVSVSIRGRERK